MKIKLVLIVFFFTLKCYLVHSYSDMQKNVIISLGYRCQPAMQLRFNNLRFLAYPFDWLITPFESMYELINNDFQDFMLKENLVYRRNFLYSDDNGAFVSKIYTHIWEKKYNVIFRHDFPLNAKFMEKYSEVLEKYSRRIQRFLGELNSNKHIYFIRQSITKKEATKLVNLLTTKFSGLKFTLVAIDSSEEIKSPWNIEHVKNYYMPIPTPYLRDGNNLLWTNLFKNLGLLSQDSTSLSTEETKPLYQNLGLLYDSI